ncbi:MAG: DUF2214 family protein [Hyphomonadaceae bacterium]
MLWHDAAFSYLHFTFALILTGALAAEAFVLRLPVDGRVARLLLRIDAFYGASAVAVILAGLARVFWGLKDEGFYGGQPFFWAKMATFAVIGLISIAPTLRFIRWVKAANADAAFAAPEAEVKAIRRAVMVELHLLALVPLFAVLMARGVGG